MRLAITGISGYLGQRLTHLIASELERGDGDVEFVLGVDIRHPAIDLPEEHYEFARMDICDSRLQELFRRHRIDAALHLVFALDPLRDRVREYEIDVEGTKNFLAACERGEVWRIFMLSSATAYGAHPDRRLMREDAPLRAVENDFDYARNKAIVEDVCADYVRDHPGVRFTTLRPVVLIGPNISNYISRNLTRRRPITLGGYDPEFQFLHEDDAAGAVRKALSSQVEGAINVAPDGTLRISEAIELIGARPLRLPSPVATLVTALMWRLGRVEAPPGYLDFVRYPWTADNTRMKEELGYEPRYTSREALLDFARARGLVAAPELAAARA